MRHTVQPLTAGDRHGFPVRFDRAWQRFALCMFQCMGLMLRFCCTPSPGRDVRVDCADDRLTAGIYMYVLDDDLLLALAAIAV